MNDNTATVKSSGNSQENPKPTVADSSDTNLSELSPEHAETIARFDEVIGQEVECAIKNVIDDSVQQVFGNGTNTNQYSVDRHVLQAMTQSLEGSLQNVIQTLAMDSISPSQKEITDSTLGRTSHSPADHVSSSMMNARADLHLPLEETAQSVSQSQADGEVDFSSFRFVPTNAFLDAQSKISESGAHSETDKLKNWKEAGKALRLALNKFATTPEHQINYLQTLHNSVPLPGDVSNTGIHTDALISDSQSLWSAFTPEGEQFSQESLRDWKKDSSPLMQPQEAVSLNKKNLCPKKSRTLQNQQESRLARSMQQSLAMSSESDPMNQMWDDYQNTHVLSSHNQRVGSCNVPNISQDLKSIEKGSQNEGMYQESCDKLTNGDNKDNDLPLSELRERMRKLVSNLPISKNRNGAIGKDCDVANSDQGAKNLSPKNMRRRHHKNNKSIDLKDSDEETGNSPSNVQRSPPKVRSVQKMMNGDSVGVERDTSDIKTQPEAVKDSGDSMPELVSETESDLSQVSATEEDNKKPIIIVNKKSKKSAPAKKKPKSQKANAVNVQKAKETNVLANSNQRHLLKQTESMLNFADVESTESEIVSSNVEDNLPRSKKNQSSNLTKNISSSSHSPIELGVSNTKVNKEDILAADSDDSMPSLQSSSEEEEDIAASIIREKYQGVPANTVPLYMPCAADDEEDVDLFEDLPELVMSESGSEDEHDITLSQREVAALQEIAISDCSEDDEDGGEADDEFECDCNICQRHAGNIQNGGDSNPFALRYMEDFTRGLASMPSVDEIDDSDSPGGSSLVSPLGWLSPEANRRDMLDLMFTNVIMHMLSVYPDLLDEQAPAPVSTDLIKSLKVIKISSKQKDEDCSCSICLCQFDINDDAKQLPCNHFFHPLCIEAWLKKAGTCPVCRHVLS